MTRDEMAAVLRNEFADWIADHAFADLFDWNVAAENVLRAANDKEPPPKTGDGSKGPYGP